MIDPEISSPSEATQINVHDEIEVGSFAEQLGVSPLRLKNAVEAAGPKLDDVEIELGRF